MVPVTGWRGMEPISGTASQLVAVKDDRVLRLFSSDCSNYEITMRFHSLDIFISHHRKKKNQNLI